MPPPDPPEGARGDFLRWGLKARRRGTESAASVLAVPECAAEGRGTGMVPHGALPPEAPGPRAQPPAPPAAELSRPGASPRLWLKWARGGLARWSVCPEGSESRRPFLRSGASQLLLFGERKELANGEAA